MSIINKYIEKKILIINLVTLFTVTLLLFFLQGSKYVDLVISKGLDPKYLFYITMVSMPTVWNETIPLILFTSVLFTWQSLITTNELVILQTLGLSYWQIIRPILVSALVAASICFVLSTVVINTSYLQFIKLKHVIGQNFNIRVIDSNRFMQLTPDTTIYVEKNDKIGGLTNMFINTTNKGKEYTIYAQSAKILKDKSELKLLLKNGSLQSTDNTTQAVNFLNFSFYVFNIPKSTNSYSKTHRIGAKEMYLWELLQPNSTYFVQNIKIHQPNIYKTVIKEFYREFNKRIMNVVLALLLPIVAIYFFTKSAFNRKSPIGPILKSIITCIIIKATAFVAVANLSTLFSIGLVYMIFLLMAGYMTAKMVISTKKAL